MARLALERAILLFFSCVAMIYADQDANAHFQARFRAAEAKSLHKAAQKHKRCWDLDVCKKLGRALRHPGEPECRYPAAELCPRRCGRCHQVQSASSCQLSRNAVTATFAEKNIDWGEYFQGMLGRADGLVHKGGGRMISNGSLWMAEFPHFFSEEEADHLANIAESLEIERENDLPHNIRNVDKIDCEAHECLLDPLVSEIYRRTSELVGLPMGNFESMEFLRYTKGQHYAPHTDPDTSDFLEQDPETWKSGLRVMTVFFYFTDVTKGGETGFPKVDLTVTPTKGKAVVWANVESDWWKTTHFSEHTSIPVKKGKKMAANFWVHPYEYRMPAEHSQHCYPQPDDD